MDRPAVLIVDDMEVNRDILSFYFRKEYTVLEAADGEEAIDTIKKYTDRIALVFLDFYMPGKSGLDVLSFMQTDNYNIPVIMVTGEPDMSLKSKLLLLVRQILFINLLTLMLFMVSLLSIFNDRKLKE